MNINYYNPYVREELMLYHHGVLGQRWGKQNGPPYPLAAGAHSASEKKAGWRKSLSGKISDHRRRKADRDAANDVAVQTGTNALNFSKHVTKQNSGYGTMRRYGEGLIKSRVSKEYADQYNKSRKKYLDAVSKIELKDRRPLDEAKKKNPDFVVKGEKDEAGDSNFSTKKYKKKDPYLIYKKARDNFDNLMTEGANKETLLKAEKKINEAFKKTEKFAPRAEALLKSGYSYEDISRKLNIPMESVYWYVGYPGANSWKK